MHTGLWHSGDGQLPRDPDTAVTASCPETRTAVASWGDSQGQASQAHVAGGDRASRSVRVY